MSAVIIVYSTVKEVRNLENMACKLLPHFCLPMVSIPQKAVALAPATVESHFMLQIESTSIGHTAAAAI